MFKSANATHCLEKQNIPVKTCYQIINGCAGTFTKEQIQTLQANSDAEVYEDVILTSAALQRNATWGLAHLSSKHKLRIQDPLKYQFIYEYNDFSAGQNVDVYTQVSILDILIFMDMQDMVLHFIDPLMKIKVVMEPMLPGKRFGVAKHARIISVKVLDGNPPHGYASDLLEYAYKSAQKLHRQGRCSVVNISIGLKKFKPIDDAIAKTAAGNDAQAVSNVSSAHSQDVITVAASDISDQKASISNWGEGVNIFAPGEKITSLGIQSQNSYVVSSGTSMAAAHVSGLAANFLTLKDYTTAQMRDELIHYALKGILNNIQDSQQHTPNLLAHNQNEYEMSDPDSDSLPDIWPDESSDESSDESLDDWLNENLDNV
ncbi:hypothetical protein C0995_011712 [Termitomyces sp. Mi166|nr:hypothetical protein C0995_011712 [Termitomyces sp. Mi166\